MELAPAIQLRSQITNLFPKQTCRTITAAALQLNNRRGDFDHARIEINRTASRELKCSPGPGDHSTAHQTAWIAKNLFRPTPPTIDEKIKFRFQADHGARRSCGEGAFV